MLDFIKSNWTSILLAIIVIGGAVVAIRLGYKNKVKQCLLALVIRAEKMYGGKTGEVKLSAVANWIYEKLPAIARIFLTSKDIEKLINRAVVEMKKYLASNDSALKLVEDKGE